LSNREFLATSGDSFWKLTRLQDTKPRESGPDSCRTTSHAPSPARCAGCTTNTPRAQAKLVQVLQGEIYDVAVDIRRGSPNFGKWVGVTLSAENHHQMYIPEGFAHGFCVLSESALFMYKCSDYYVPEDEYGVQWNDPVLNIRWPVERPVLSERDLGLPALGSIAADALPSF
jgi:dTDP-4-dehydrorhamnose 3,5-epimerase